MTIATKPPDSPLRTRSECAAFCRVSPDGFDRHVRPQLPPPRMVGRRPFWLQGWLDEWATGDDERERRPPPVEAPAAAPRDARRAAPSLPLTAGQRVRLGIASPDDLEWTRQREERRASRAAAVARLSSGAAGPAELWDAERRQLRRLLTRAQRVKYGLATPGEVDTARPKAAALGTAPTSEAHPRDP